MATYEAHIEGLTQIAIESSDSAPTQGELDEFIKEGIFDIVSKVALYKPQDINKFTSTTNNTSTVARKGQLISVMREHDSTTILRPCSQIPAQLRYEATDINSLHYRSKYNPGFYELDGNIYTVPSAGSGDNDIVVTQVNYDTTINCTSVNYLGAGISYFPIEYENLLGLYAAAKACHAAASDIQNNMPTKPTAPISPDFSDDNVDLPSEPIFSQPKLDIKGALSKINVAISREDFDLVDNEISLFDKQMEEYDKNFEAENAIYTKELEVFKSDLDRVTKNKDRNLQNKANEYKSELDKYVAEDAQYKSQLNEKLTKYKWFVEQHHILLSQYNSAFGASKRQAGDKKKKEEKPKGEE